MRHLPPPMALDVLGGPPRSSCRLSGSTITTRILSTDEIRSSRFKEQDMHHRAIEVTELSNDVLLRVTGGEAPELPQAGAAQPPQENKSYLRQARQVVRDASGGFATGPLRLRSPPPP